MYSLFPEELTKWATFGAYDLIRENKLQEKIIEVCGTDKPLSFEDLNQKIKEYVSKNNSLDSKQLKMLEMLGLNLTLKLDKRDFKQLAISENSMYHISDGTYILKNIELQDKSQEK